MRSDSQFGRIDVAATNQTKSHVAFNNTLKSLFSIQKLARTAMTVGQIINIVVRQYFFSLVFQIGKLKFFGQLFTQLINITFQTMLSSITFAGARRIVIFTFASFTGVTIISFQSGTGDNIAYFSLAAAGLIFAMFPCRLKISMKKFFFFHIRNSENFAAA